MTAVPLPFEATAQLLVRRMVETHQKWRQLRMTSPPFLVATRRLVLEVAELYDVLVADKALPGYQVDRIVNEYARRRLTAAADEHERTQAVAEAMLSAARTSLMREFL